MLFQRLNRLTSEAQIREAKSQDAGAVAGILKEAARWLEQAGMPLWREGELEAARIITDVRAGLFFLAEISGHPAGTVKFQLEDCVFWPDARPQEAAYVHRLAVRRHYAGTGLSTALLRWAVERTRALGRRYLRLDCDASRLRLRAVYERFGFRHHSDRQVGSYFVARYEYDLASCPVANPWLDIPEADYVGHMSSPAVGQHIALNRILAGVLRDIRPKAVLVVGCSTGNGFEHIDPAITARVTGVDINPDYLRSLADRFAGRGFELNLQCADLAQAELEHDSYDLVHAALVFEYLPWETLLVRLAKSLMLGGMLSIVLQRPSVLSPAVTPTAFTSLLTLESLFHFVDPDAVVQRAQADWLDLRDHRTELLPSGKAFEVLRFVKAGVSSPQC